MLQQLKRERDNFETEKAESREIVKMLETRLKQMTAVITYPIYLFSDYKNVKLYILV